MGSEAEASSRASVLRTTGFGAEPHLAAKPAGETETHTEGCPMDKPCTILYFAWLREKTGLSEETLALPESVRTLAGLIALLIARGPGYASAFATPGLVRAAVNQVFVKPEDAVAPGDEVAFFPPVTGG